MTQAERNQVRDAVVGGFRVPDPALRPAACGLAAEFLSGRLQTRNRSMLVSTVMIVAAGAIPAGIVLATGPPLTVKVMWGFGCAALALGNLRRLKPARERTERAQRLNSSEFG